MRFRPAPGHLRLEPGEQAQRLGVALEAAAGERAAGIGQGGQRGLPVVAERRVAEIVRQAGRVDQVGVAAEDRAEVAADLRDLERVGEPGPREIGRPGPHHLRLRREPAQGGAVQDPRAVPLELRALGALGRLRHPALRVQRRVSHLSSVPTSVRQFEPRAMRSMGPMRIGQARASPNAHLAHWRRAEQISGCRCRRWRRRPGPPRGGRSGPGTASRTRSRARPGGRTRPTPGRRRARRRRRA